MLLFMVPAQGHATTYTVDSTVDAVDANLLDGFCVTAAGQCTLRAAIQTANAAPVDDTIVLPAGTYALTIAGAGETAAATGDLNISGVGGALTITGAGAATTIIDGGDLDGVFETRIGAVVTISGVTIRNGNNINGLGGGVHVGNGTTLTLNNSVVTANAAGGGAPGAGGVDNSGTLTMNTVAVTNNVSDGGGVNNGAAGVLTWTTGEVSGNTGGGGVQNNGNITLTNVTISGNSSAGQGAGIDSRGTTTLQNVTVSGNTSAAGVLAVGGVRNNAGVLITARNTIISGNLPINCGGGITSLGNNIDSGNTCLFAGAGDAANTDPLLGALALNGGVLQTRALLLGSPAIDTGTATGCPGSDARGILRAGFAPCDKGAFEFRPPKLTVTLPSPFDFGTVTSGTTADHAITLTNAGDGDLVIGSVAVLDPLVAPFSKPADNCTGLTLKLIPVAAANSCTITTRFAPTTTATTTDTFNIPSNDPVTPVATFTLSGTGTTTLVPVISVTDSIAPNNDNLVPFGGVTIGLTSDATVTVANTGAAPLVIGTIASPAAPFSITSNACSGQTLAAAAACSLTVRFAPTANVSSNATFTIPNNIAPVTVALSGSGISVAGNNPPSAPVLVAPTDGQTGVPTTMTFLWNGSVDPDGDAVTYRFSNCTDANFTTGCTNADVTAAAPSGLLFAGLGSFGVGFILIGFAKRSRMAMLAITLLLLSGSLFMSCKSSSDDTPAPPAGQISNTVSNLAPNTTYYWKVVADDGKGGLASSEVRSYTTAP